MKKFRWVSLFVFAFLAGCGGGGGGGGSPPPPVVNVPSATIFYPYNNMLAGGLMTVEADVYDGSGISRVELLVNGATVATSYSGNGTYNMDFNADGLATGNHSLVVRAWNKNGMLGESSPVPIRVNAQDLRKQALQYLTTYNAERDIKYVSGVRRWATLPIKIEVSPEIPVADVRAAANFWAKYTGITFNVYAGTVTSLGGSWRTGVVFIGYGNPSNPSFDGQASNKVSGVAYEASVITIRNGRLNVRLLAHEIGHAIFFGSGSYNSSHTTNGTIMDSDSEYLRMDPVASKAIRILYFELYPGAPVPVI